MIKIVVDMMGGDLGSVETKKAVSEFAKLYKNQITYDFANLYNSFEFNISKL